MRECQHTLILLPFPKQKSDVGTEPMTTVTRIECSKFYTTKHIKTPAWKYFKLKVSHYLLSSRLQTCPRLIASNNY